MVNISIFPKLFCSSSRKICFCFPEICAFSSLPMLVYLIRGIMLFFTHFWWHNSKIGCRRLLPFISKAPSSPFWIGQVKMPKNRPGIPVQGWPIRKKREKITLSMISQNWWILHHFYYYGIVVKCDPPWARRSIVRARSIFYGELRAPMPIWKWMKSSRFPTFLN